MSVERPVIFPGPDGEPLSGILHEPERPRSPRIGVNLLNPGLKSRVAPNRLNVVLARRLAHDGYWVLRFDPPGVGDSGGELPEELLPELWQEVQRGAFVDSTRLANREFVRNCDLDEVVGIGNCGGAITALMAAADDPLVRRLVLLDLPVTIRDTDPGKLKMIRGKQHGAKVLTGYWRRAKDWRAWLRLLSGRSDLQTITTALRARFLDPAREANLRRAETPPPENPGTAAGEAPQSGEHLSELFVEAVTRFHERDGRMLFVNAGNYDNTFVFDRLFGDVWLRPGSPWAERHPRVVVAGANHVYGTPEWRATVLDAVLGWLEGRPSPGAAARAGTNSAGPVSEGTR